MLREFSLRVAALGTFGLFLAGSVAAGAQSAARPSKPAAVRPTRVQLDPKAIEVLKAVTGRLVAARTLSVVAVETVDSMSHPEVPSAPATKSEVTLERPDKVRVIVSRDGTPWSLSHCNGNTMMTYSPARRALVIAKAPPTIAGCLKDVYKASASDYPLIDLIVADPSSDPIPGLTHASYLGRSQAAGETSTDLVTYSGDKAFVKMWVGAQDKLPQRLEVVNLDDPNRLRRTVVLSDWKIDVPVRPDVFTSLNADGRNHMESAEPRAVGTSGIQTAPKARPLTLYTFSAKYWGSSAPPVAYSNYYGGTGQTTSYGAGGYYQSPDGYTYFAPAYSGHYPPATVRNYAPPCYDCGNDYWTTEEETAASFNLSLSTSGWYNAVPAPGFSQTIPNVTTLPPFEVGQIMTTLPVGCAAYTRGAAFYLCGSQWFAGVYGPNGELYFRVISPPY